MDQMRADCESFLQTSRAEVVFYEPLSRRVIPPLAALGYFGIAVPPIPVLYRGRQNPGVDDPILPWYLLCQRTLLGQTHKCLGPLLAG
jgi:hypothetical protein